MSLGLILGGWSRVRVYGQEKEGLCPKQRSGWSYTEGGGARSKGRGATPSAGL